MNTRTEQDVSDIVTMFELSCEHLFNKHNIPYPTSRSFNHSFNTEELTGNPDLTVSIVPYSQQETMTTTQTVNTDYDSDIEQWVLEFNQSMKEQSDQSFGWWWSLAFEQD